MKNVFGVQQPDKVDVMVQQYHWGRTTLLLRLKRQNSPEVQYIKFQGVEYFMGPMEWTDAAFEQRPDEECLQVMRDTGRANDIMTVQHLQDKSIRLYTIERPNTTIAIIAHLAHRYSG